MIYILVPEGRQRLAGDEITGIVWENASRPERTPDQHSSSGAPAGAQRPTSRGPAISSPANLQDPSGINHTDSNWLIHFKFNLHTLLLIV